MLFSSHIIIFYLLFSRTSSAGKPAEDLKCTLPPNTCYETAFTSESPITRIVPQSSFDTLHLPTRPASACSAMKRNASAPKLLETSSLEAETQLNKSSAHRNSIFSLSNEKFSTISGTRWQSKPKLKNDSVSGSLHRERMHGTSASESEKLRTNHNCGKLIVVDKTPPLPPRHHSKPPPVHRNATRDTKVSSVFKQPNQSIHL